MGLHQEVLFSKGDVASIYEETLSDGSHVYNVRINDSRDDENSACIDARDQKHAVEIFKVINDFQHVKKFVVPIAVKR